MSDGFLETQMKEAKDIRQHIYPLRRKLTDEHIDGNADVNESLQLTNDTISQLGAYILAVTKELKKRADDAAVGRVAQVAQPAANPVADAAKQCRILNVTKNYNKNVDSVNELTASLGQLTVKVPDADRDFQYRMNYEQYTTIKIDGETTIKQTTKLKDEALQLGLSVC